MKFNTIEELFGTLQQSIIAEWRKHLQTSKYSKHIALDEFYKEMPELVDTLIEDYNGHAGHKVEDFKNILNAEDYDALSYLEALHELTQTGYDLLPEDAPELKSDLDAIKSLIDSTMYKVRELKEGMKSLKDFLMESLNVVENYSNIYIDPLTWNLTMLVDTEPDNIEAYLNDEIDDKDSIKFYKDFAAFLKSVKANVYTYETFNVPDPDEVEIYEFLYKIDAIKKNEHGFILNKDGDCETSTICVIKKSLSSSDKKKLKDFLDAYRRSSQMMVVEEF